MKNFWGNDDDSNNNKNNACMQNLSDHVTRHEYSIGSGRRKNRRPQVATDSWFFTVPLPRLGR